MYSLAVSYGTFDAVNIDIIINKKKIDVSNLRWNSGSVNYNGTEQVKTILNLPKGVIATYEGNKATNVGDYTASATLSLDEEAEVNYYLEETTVPDCTWSILQAVASVDVYDASKVYDGEAVDIKYYCGIKGVVPTFKYRVAGSEAAFTTDVPVDAGEYEVEVSVGWSENYIGFVSTSTFTIHKKILKVPYGNNPNNESMKVTKYTGSDQTFELEGLDLDLMEVVVIDDEVSQKDPGYYFYNVRIKDEYQTNYAFDGLNSFDAIPYTWVINGDLANYIEYVKIDGAEISASDFDLFDSFDYGTEITIKTKEGYRVDSCYESADVVYEFTIDYNNCDITIYSIDSENPVYNKLFKMKNSNGIDAIYVNGKLVTDDVYDYCTRNVRLLGAHSVELYLELNDNATSILVNGKLYQEPMIIDLDELLDNEIYISYGEDYDYSISLNIITDMIIDSINAIELNGDSGDAITYNFENEDNYCIDAYVDEGTLIGLQVNFTEAYKNYSYKLVHAGTKEGIDFTNLTIEDFKILVQIYDDNGNYVDDFEVFVDQSYFGLEGFDYYTNERTGVNYYFKTTKDADITIEKKDYAGWDYFELVKEGSETVTPLNYDRDGVYREKYAMKATYNGKTYTRYFYVDVVYSDDLTTYFNSVDYYFKDDDEYRRIYNGSDEASNIISFDDEGYMEDVYLRTILNFNSDDMEYSLKKGYTFVSRKAYFVDVNDYEKARMIFEFVINDGEEDITLYAIGYFNGFVSHNQNLVGERIVVFNSADGSDSYYQIKNNKVTIDNVNSLYGFNFYFEERCDVVLLNMNSYSTMISETDIDYLYITLSEAGEYLLMVNAPASEYSRYIYITINGDFSTVLKAYVEEDKPLYIENVDDTNFIHYYDYDVDKEIYVGYFGNSSSSYIDNDRVYITLKGVLAGYLYFDDELNDLITEETDKFDVLYDNDNRAYVKLYSKEMIIYLYFSDKPEAKTKISFGDQEYGIIYSLNDPDNPYFGDVTEGDIHLGDTFDTMTLTTDKVYNDFSYSIIIPKYEDQLESFESYSEMEEAGILYRVKNASTLSVDIPVDFQHNPYIVMGILPEGSNDESFSTDNLLYVGVYAGMKLFSIDNGNETYYCTLEADFSNDELRYKEITNAKQTQKKDSNVPFSTYYVFYIGVDEEDNIDDDGYYSFKVDTLEGSDCLYYDLALEQKVPYDSTTGMTKFLVKDTGMGPKACIFYIVIGDIKINVILGFC